MFESLPDELKIKILSQLDTIDLINFCKAFPMLTYLSHDKDVSRYVSFYLNYEMDFFQIRHYLTESPRCDVIIALNINCVYWISPKDLRLCVRRLKCLQKLYAVDTRLGLSEKDISFYLELKNLDTLAVSTERTELKNEAKVVFSKLKRLYVHLFKPCSGTFLVLGSLLNEMTNLEEIWVVDRSETTIRDVFYALRYLPQFIKKCTLLLNNICFDLKICKGKLEDFKRVYYSNRQGVQMSFVSTKDDLCDIYSPKFSEDIELWSSYFNKFHCDSPFGREDAYLLSHNKYNLETIHFRELNLSHAPVVCCGALKALNKKILFSDNTIELKKLSVNFCICDEDLTNKTDCHENLFKKPRIVKSKNDNEFTCFENLVNHCQKLEILELVGCNCSSKHQVFTLRGLNYLKNLKRLIITDAQFGLDCTFLTKLFKFCCNLKSFHFRSRIESTNTHLLKGLESAQNLDDLELENIEIPIDRLFESLQTNRINLRRLSIKCNKVEKFSVAPLKNFLEYNERLIFLALLIETLPKSCHSDIRALLHKYKNNPQKNFLVDRIENVTNKSRIAVPNIHMSEMVNRKTEVGVLDCFNGFVEEVNNWI